MSYAPNQGYAQGPPPSHFQQSYGQPVGQQYVPQPQVIYQQAPPPKEEKSHGCLYTCIAAMCCCWLCGETCECCLECLDCCC
ncbi:hypothetical protein VTI74DRAFT_5444 [Chaetomium olivicolor]